MDQFGLLVAMCLGDGNISIRDSRLNVSHSVNQSELIFYKKFLIEQILNKQVNVYNFDNSGYPGIRFSVNHPIFHEIRNILYINNFKNINVNILNTLTPKAIAIWYMDDGSLSKKIRDNRIHAFELSISTYCSEYEAELIIDYFSKVWNINFTKRFNKGKFTIRCGTHEARKFIDLIRPYMISSMFYKINMDIERNLPS